MLYLLHFDRPTSPRHTCQHYLGFSDDPVSRIQSHWLGNGARLPQVAHERGIGFTVVRLWTGDRTRERRLKNRHEHPALCPICNPDTAWANEPGGSLTPDEIVETLIPF
jgi:hypothetical protein